MSATRELTSAISQELDNTSAHSSLTAQLERAGYLWNDCIPEITTDDAREEFAASLPALNEDNLPEVLNAIEQSYYSCR